MDTDKFLLDVKKQVQTQQAMENAKMLIDKMSERCFQICVLKPGSSLSSSEQKCATQCMDKYIHAWNLVSTTHINRIQRERERVSQIQ